MIRSIAVVCLVAAPSALLDAAAPPRANDSASLPADIAAEIARAEYRVTPGATGLSAPNRAHDLRTRFLAGGIDVRPRTATKADPTWQLTWQTTAWGREGRVEPVERSSAEPRLQGERVTYALNGFDEWYENREAGLEQGFTVHERPSGGGPLVVAGRFGGLHPQLAGDEANAVDLLDDHGALILRYAGLRAWDADGRDLPSHLQVDDGEVAIVVDDDRAAYPVTIDPMLHSPSWTAESDQANAEFGYSVATAGDVNGDGFSDVIVGAWQYDGGDSNEGRAYLFLGSASGLATTPAWTAEGNQPDAHFGYCVSTAGDVNGDGFHDVIIGADQYDNGEPNEGRAFVYLGSASGLNASPAWTAESNEDGANLGASVSTAGDVNGDGFSDVIVGVRFGDNGQSNEGRAFVYHGSASGLATTAAWTGESNQDNAFFGWSVATAGDVNADGFADVVVGAISYDNGSLDEGRAYVYHGSASGLAATPAWTGESNQGSAAYGWSVSLAGDVDGDGFGDVVVGAISWDEPGLPGAGRAFVYRGSGLGLGLSPAWTFSGYQSVQEFGASVGTAGDLNGDGFAEFVVGLPSADDGQTNEGVVRIYRGSADGPDVYMALWADQGGAFFGTTVATAGDVNGDGFSDLIVGARAFDNGQTNEGRAFVYLGSGDYTSFPEAWAESDQANARFGFSVATAGDVNGDGFSDVIVGAPQYDDGETNEGRASVFYGASAGLETSPAWTVDGNLFTEHFGESVASAGDVNGDGFSDVIVGAPQHVVGFIATGAAFVFLGSASGLATSPAWTVEGEAGARLGTSVATAGDVNGDGYSDVIVGAPGGSGRADLYLGSASGLASSRAWTAIGDPVSHFGECVASAGDVNGDGYSDVIVGAYAWDHDEADEGGAFLYFGSASGLSATPNWAAESDQAAAHFGTSVASAGDVNGDGYSDILVGAPYYDAGALDEGQVYLYLGSFAGPSLFPWWTHQGGFASSWAGLSVSTAGDVNGDGFSDVVIVKPGPSGSSGSATLCFGSPTGLTPVTNTAGPGGSFGFSAGTAGDVNGDGFSDFVFGAPYLDNGQTDEGQVLLSYGNGGEGLHRLPAQVRANGTTPIAALGRSDSPSAFRLEALGRAAGGRARVRMQYEVEEFGDPFDGAGLVTTTPLDTGIPAFGEGSAVESSQLVSGLSGGTLYRWRMRFLSTSPYFPRTPWFSLAANGSGEADLRTAPPGTAVAEVAATIGGLRLEPGAPNPFALATRLAYSLPRPGRMRLAVFDVSGRRVAVLADGLQDAGQHVLTWDGRDEDRSKLAAGVYFARLEFDGRVEGRKLILVR